MCVRVLVLTRDRVHIRSVGLTDVEILLRGVTDAAEVSIPLNHTVKNTVVTVLSFNTYDEGWPSVGPYDGQPYLATLYQIRA